MNTNKIKAQFQPEMPKEASRKCLSLSLTNGNVSFTYPRVDWHTVSMVSTSISNGVESTTLR